jgi:hypothetical protein
MVVGKENLLIIALVSWWLADAKGFENADERRCSADERTPFLDCY